VRRWGASGKTTNYSKGKHVSLLIPPDLRHGLDQTRIQCIVLEQPKEGYHRLLCEDGVLEGLYRPGSLQKLVGYQFSSEVMRLYEEHRRWQKGTVPLGHVARKLSSESPVVVVANRVPVSLLKKVAC
jgi:hypothetical protein